MKIKGRKAAIAGVIALVVAALLLALGKASASSTAHETTTITKVVVSGTGYKKPTVVEQYTSSPGVKARVHNSSYTKGTDHGCRTLKIYNKSVSPGGYKHYTWKTSASWCWRNGGPGKAKYGEVYRQKAASRPSYLASTTRYKGFVRPPSHGYYYWAYAICCHQNHSGWSYAAQAHMDITVPQLGEIAAKYPSNSVWLHGNGTWSARWNG